MSDLPHWDEAGSIEFVSLVAGEQHFCIEITQIREIRRWTPVTALPYADAAVLGVMNLRGAVIPIMDLAAKLGLGNISPSARHVVIVVAVHDRTIGLLVESVSEILTVKGGMIRQTPQVGRDDSMRCIRGLLSIEGEMSRILDLDALFPAEKEDAA